MTRLTLWTMAWFACGAVAAEPSLPPRVAQVIQDRVAARQIPTIVIGVVDGDQSRIYTFGKLDSGAPATSKTIYEIGSITKTFTATLLAQGIVEGQLRLDQPLASLLPGFTVPSKDDRVITLANVAEQNSGLPNFPNNIRPVDPKDPYADYDASKLRFFLSNYVLPREPGAHYEYSSLAVGLLGYALSVHANTSYANLVKKEIFQPLGMDDSSVSTGKTDPFGMAGGHNADGKPAPNLHLDALAGAGGIRSTGDDMLRYLEANMGRMPSHLSAAMQLAHIPRASIHLPSNKIGLIWRIQHSVDTHDGPDVVWHGGMTYGYASFIGFTADHKHGVVVLTNAQVDVIDLGFAILVPNWPLPSARKHVTPPPQ